MKPTWGSSDYEFGDLVEVWCQVARAQFVRYLPNGRAEILQFGLRSTQYVLVNAADLRPGKFTNVPEMPAWVTRGNK